MQIIAEREIPVIPSKISTENWDMSEESHSHVAQIPVPLTRT